MTIAFSTTSFGIPEEAPAPPAKLQPTVNYYRPGEP